MLELIIAIAVGIALVCCSMIGGAVIYLLLKDYVQRNLRTKD
jgi:hypothetical protein